MEALRLEDVHLDFPTRAGVLQGIDLAVPRGGLVVLEGRSGSGKSSLLSVAAGLERPTRGAVAVAGRPMPRGADERARLRAQHVGLVFQHLHLLGELTVAENVELPLRLRGMARRERRRRTAELLEAFSITDLAARRPLSLSGGEQQRAAIARALAPQPALLLVDEPTSNLDAENAMTVIHALKKAAQQGAGVLVATHDELFRRAGPVHRIEAGRLRARAEAAAGPA